MTVIQLVVLVVVLVILAAGVNSVPRIPPETKRIINLGVGAILAILFLVFVLSLLGIGLHRRI